MTLPWNQIYRWPEYQNHKDLNPLSNKQASAAVQQGSARICSGTKDIHFRYQFIDNIQHKQRYERAHAFLLEYLGSLFPEQTEQYHQTRYKPREKSCHYNTRCRVSTYCDNNAAIPFTELIIGQTLEHCKRQQTVGRLQE